MKREETTKLEDKVKIRILSKFAPELEPLKIRRCPDIEVKEFKNTTWVSILIPKKWLEDFKEVCEKKGVDYKDVLVSGILYIKELVMRGEKTG
ncbi:MAG: hypothetical protein DRP15_02140 [Candidatus Aenigmatarchaeota archaeon]|nr:MAG: hypothetical protein DRP15_02140 [Candidatus Aenigmarchaeota archaeon]